MFINKLPSLKNIINLFNIFKNFSSIEKDDLELTIAEIMDNYIENTPLSFSSPHFHQQMDDFITTNMMSSISHIYSDIKSMEYELVEIYENIKKQYFTKYYPCRSYPDTFIRKDPNVEHMMEKIKFIENKPQPDQRTNEWYEFRYNLITASSAWKVFKSQSAINQLIVEKCKPLDVSKYSGVNTSSPMHHGNKYEDVSIMLYEYMYKTKIKDYGCIQHDKYKFLGASPDGINVDITSSLYGRMVEIKNPTTREITGIPKEDYWIQMQLQMETCNLNECDFLETQFKEYDDEESFMNDGSFTHNENNELKGVIMYFMKDGKPLYEYMPLYYSESEYNIWMDTIMEKHTNITWIKNIFWRLAHYSCVLVLRNKLWFKHAICKIAEVWDIIVKERQTGFEHRAPKRSNRSVHSNSITEATNNECLINTNNLTNQIIYIDTKFESIDVSSSGTN